LSRKLKNFWKPFGESRTCTKKIEYIAKSFLLKNWNPMRSVEHDEILPVVQIKFFNYLRTGVLKPVSSKVSKVKSGIKLAGSTR